MTGIDGKVVVLTGASSGIGDATARLLGGRGASLVLGARRADRLDQLVAELTAAGGTAVSQATDVRRQSEVQALIDLAADRFGQVDVLISNAGVGPVAPLDDLRVAEWEDMVDVNIKGLLYAIAAALPVFRRQGSGHFVTTVSTAGLRIVPDQVVYAATKNAARTICEGLRQEAGPNVRVTAVSPGFIQTDFAASASNPQTRAALLERRDEIAIPPDSIAREIAFAIEQPADVDINEVVVRPTAQQ